MTEKQGSFVCLHWLREYNAAQTAWVRDYKAAHPCVVHEGTVTPSCRVSELVSVPCPGCEKKG